MQLIITNDSLLSTLNQCSSSFLIKSLFSCSKSTLFTHTTTAIPHTPVHSFLHGIFHCVSASGKIYCSNYHLVILKSSHIKKYLMWWCTASNDWSPHCFRGQYLSSLICPLKHCLTENRVMWHCNDLSLNCIVVDFLLSVQCQGRHPTPDWLP